jgi:hypothetical protein
VFDGAINGVRFRTYVKQALAPTLHTGDVVVMDNLAAHKVKGVREAIVTAAAPVCCLPRPRRLCSVQSGNALEWHGPGDYRLTVPSASVPTVADC